MGVDLGDCQRADHRGQGRMTGADGRGYARRGTRAKLRDADVLVASGAPLVLDMVFGSGQWEWFEGAEAAEVWADVRPHVISGSPTRNELAKHHVWNAGVWETDDGTPLLYLTGHC